MPDPSEPIAGGKETDGVLPVSGTAFYTLQGVPGQLIQASLTSKRFVPLLRLYDANGNLLGSSGEDSDTGAARERDPRGASGRAGPKGPEDR